MKMKQTHKRARRAQACQAKQEVVLVETNVVYARALGRRR